MSSARLALDGASCAPRNEQTLRALRDPRRRLVALREDLPDEVQSHQPVVPFQLGHEAMLQNLRSARRAAPGPSGMTSEHFVTILGTPLGHPDFVEASLQAKSREHDTLFDRLVAVPDLQCAWLLLLFCVSTRANYMLRVVHPELSHGFAARHDSRVWSTLTRLLGVEGSECARQRASLPFSIGGLGLRSAVRTSTAAYWSSWADTLSMIRARHPTVADDVVIALSANLGGPHLQGANSFRRRLQDAGFDAPEWGDLSRGFAPWTSPRARSPTPWVATGCGARSRRFLLQGSGVAKIDPVGASFVTFTRWTNGWTSFHLLPCVSPVSVRCPGFPGSPLAAPLVPIPFVQCKLPVWPSTRLAWPSPCSLSLGWGFGSRGFSLESAAAHLPRGWSPSLPECQSSRSGFASLGKSGQSTNRDHC